MPKVPRISASEIAEKQMPGWKAVEGSGPIKTFGAQPQDAKGVDATKAAPDVDAVMPSTEQLRRKFLGNDSGDAIDESKSDAIESNVEVVEMKSGDLERTVGVNIQTQKVEWSQG